MTKDEFTRLVLESEETLYKVSMSMLRNEKDCEDAVQTAILTAYEKLNTLKNEEYFKTWIVRILINTCNKHLNSRKKIVDIQDYQNTTQTSNFSPEELEVRLAVEKLPLKIRQVVVLYYTEGFSVKDIKDILKIPEGTVKSRLSKGRELLKIELDK
ncbi:MAG: sigma-70 family RNA polymerase sigma factor [Oscillospiraceae bacterium]|nr:sigma-70 family RNA polymerase sigma factor [Oscillospiraceae bacterium]